MREQPDLTEALRTAIEDNGYNSGELNEITSRVCESDTYTGTEYNFYGQWIPLRPVIDTIADKEGFAIENIHFVDESTSENNLEPHVGIFVVDMRPQTRQHPAFTSH